MRLTLRAHDAVTRASTAVLVDAPADTPVSGVVPALQNVLAADISGATAGVAVDGVTLDPRTPLASSALRDGATIVLHDHTGAPAREPRTVTSAVQVRLVSGVGAGTTVHSGPGIVLVGSAPAAQVRLDTTAATVEVVLEIDQHGGVVVSPGHEACTATIAGTPLTEPTELLARAPLAVHDTVIEVALHDPRTAAVENDDETMQLRYNRPPRMLAREHSAAFRLPNEPEEAHNGQLSVVAMLTPLVMSGALAFVFKSPTMLAFGLMSPFMMIASWWSNRRVNRRSHRERVAEYQAAKSQIEADAAEALTTERDRLHDEHPDPAALGEIAVGPGPRLWERRPLDPSHLVVRLGTRTQPSQVTLEDPAQLEHKRIQTWDIPQAPVLVDLRGAGPLGLAGPHAIRVAQWIVAQVAALHSPRDVQIYLISGRTTEDRESDWAHLLWLPHSVPREGQPCRRTIALTATDAARRISELLAQIDARTAAMRQASVQTYQGPETVVVIDDAHRLRSLPGLIRVLREGPSVGIHAVCIDPDERLLPEECLTVAVSVGQRLEVRRQREAPLDDVLPDLVVPHWFDWVSRALAPIVDTSPSVEASAVPSSSRLLDVLALDPPTPENILARWELRPRSTVAVVGESLDGPFTIDLRTDGPHGLVAGTTGSGKSELLQTIVAALAVANTPDGMTFVLVDYKGGAAFKDCVRLPHTVGMVTDLDTQLVARALESLGAELRTREHALADVGAKDLEDYTELAERDPAVPHIPRLLIVIDEFASLARELPDFVTGLVNIAQRGRSLGIHLILATQRPSGVVSPEIRANANLRIALRVTDTSESTDVIDAPDSAHISKSTPGRAFVRLGASSLVPFQSGRVGGRRPDPAHEEDPAEREVLVQPITLGELATPEPPRQKTASAAPAETRTDLEDLVDAVMAAHARTGSPLPRRPWLPPLPTTVLLDELPEQDSRFKIPLGLQDLPSLQEQRAAVLDLEVDDHLFIVGAPRTGRSSTLRTLVAAACTRLHPDELHIYGLDCGNGGLVSISPLPHVGSVVQRHQTDRAVRLLTKLTSELSRRQNLLAGSGSADLTEHNLGAEEPLAHILLLIDSWDGFVATLGELDGELAEVITTLLREGASAGIHLVITGDRMLLSSRMSTATQNKLVLRLTDRSDMSLAGIDARKLPDEIPAGRAHTAEDGLSTQLALLSTDASGQAQAAALRALAHDIRASAPRPAQGRGPLSIEVMPDHLTRAALSEAAPPTAGEIPLGLGGEDVDPVIWNPIVGGPTFLVVGPARSGRSTTLLTMALGALDAGWEVVALTPRPSSLRNLSGHPGVRAVVDGTEHSEESLAPLLGRSPDGPPVLLLADDIDLLLDIEADLWLRERIATARDDGLAIAAAGTADRVGAGFSGWNVELRKNRQGIIFQPGSFIEGDIIGARISRSDVTTTQPIGRGYAFVDGTNLLVQIADSSQGEQ